MSPGARTGAALVLAGAALGSWVAAACSEPYTGADEVTVDAAASGADADEAATIPDPCAHAAPPPPPERDDAPGTVLPAFFLALDETIFQPATDPGFDLDGVCTCDARPGTAHDGGESCLGSKAQAERCDGPGGIDNALVGIFRAFASFYPIQDVPRQQVIQGRSNVLLQIADYNGTANDKDVAVGIVQSDGLRAQGCPTSTFDPARGVWTPGWCGNDAWSITPGSVIPGSLAPVIIVRGYVREFQLVVRGSGTARVPFSDEATIAVTDPIFTGKLVPLGEDMKPRDPARQTTGREPRLWQLERGQLAGRRTAASISAGVPIGALPALAGEISTRAPRPGPCDPGTNGDPVDAGAVTYKCVP